MRYRAGILGIAFIVSLLTPVAFAQSPAEKQCLGQAKANPEQKISACDNWIARETNESLVIKPLQARAQAFFERRDCSRAIDDASRIIMISETLRDQAKTTSISNKDGIPAITRKDPDSAYTNTPLHEHFERRAYYFAYCSRDLDRAIADYDEALRYANATWYPYVKWMRIAEAKLDDKRPTLHQDRGVVHFYKGSFENAIADFDDAIRLFSASGNKSDRIAGVRNNRGNTYAAKGEFERAIADFDQAIRLQPENSGWYSARGEIWRLRGDLGRALADHDKAVTRLKQGSESLVYTRRGDTLRYLGDFKKAIVDYDRALSFSPAYSAALAGRGLAFERDGNLSRARDDFLRAVSSTDTDLQAIETARARLAAFDSGAPPPRILAAPLKSVSVASIPTVANVAPVLAPSVPLAKQAQGDRRIALIIGNSAYKSVGALANPQRDADVIATSLRNIGFEKVELVSDASREGLVNALRAFAEESEKADWAVVYYAGHGIEVNGINYMIPVDAKLAADRDVQFEAVPLDQVMASVEGAKKLKVVILDACRDNPFAPAMRKTAAPDVVAQRSTAGGVVASRSIGRGLGEVKVSGATLVVYAAKHGQIALDGEGGNSPFAVALVQRIATPGVEINKIFRLIRDDVMEATAGRQEPFTYGSLPGREDFYFVSAK